VQEIVRLHGGSIQAKSEGAWQGSEFIFSLPRMLPGSAPTVAVSDNEITLVSDMK
jgi:signal transduction histidine kinase